MYVLHYNFLTYKLLVILARLFVCQSVCTLEGFEVKIQLVTGLGDGSFMLQIQGYYLGFIIAQFDCLSAFIYMSHWKIFTGLDNRSTSHFHILIYPVVMCETLLIFEA